MASNRNPKTGGRIPPRGRTPQAPGVGRSAKRHDLERPATPGLSGDLQQGDVGQFEQGQAIAPRAGAAPRTQPPARGGGTSPGRPSPQQNLSAPPEVGAPNPLEFAGRRLGGTLGAAAGPEQQFLDMSQWFPLIKRLVTTTGTSGLLSRAYLEQLSTLQKRPVAPSLASIDQSMLDDALRKGSLER